MDNRFATTRCLSVTMPTMIKPISPFFNDTVAAPPSFPPMLTDQLELFGKCTGFTTNSPLPEAVPVTVNARDRVSAHKEPPSGTVGTSKPISRPFKVARGSTPYTKNVATGKQHQLRSLSVASTLSSLEDSDRSPESSDNDDASSVAVSDDSKIPKPVGEPGRPGRGGYTLESAVDWNHKTFAKFKVCLSPLPMMRAHVFLKKFTHNLIDEHLDTTKCASAQNIALLKLVCDKVSMIICIQPYAELFPQAQGTFPDLENYSNCWPVSDIVMMRLKYTSSRARRQETEMAAGKKKTNKVSAYTYDTR